MKGGRKSKNFKKAQETENEQRFIEQGNGVWFKTILSCAILACATRFLCDGCEQHKP